MNGRPHPSAGRSDWRGCAILALAASGALASCKGSQASNPPPQSTTTTTTARVTTGALPPDPLPSWSDGATKQALVDFVERVTREGDDFIPLDDRIAVFDNDGTLWQEKPIAEGAYTLARIEGMAERDPSLRAKKPFAAVLERDLPALKAEGKQGILEVFVASHAGTTTEAFETDVVGFLATAQHPRFHAPYTALVYAPMIELLELLRTRGFTTWVSSGGDVDFVRAVAPSIYGISKEHVIGSRLAKQLVTTSGRTEVLRQPKLDMLNDKDGKPVGIDNAIGKRPVFVAGNVRSGGDVAMLRYAHDRKGPSFQLVVHHDDPVREFAYDEPDGATLAAAREGSFTVVSMKSDWRVVFRGR